MSSEILMVLGGSAVGAYAYYYWVAPTDKQIKNIGTLVILSAGVAFAVYQYSPATAGSAAVAGAVVGPVTDAAAYVGTMLLPAA